MIASSFFGRKIREVRFQVRPRYTAGSPAMVDAATARRVADEEADACEQALSGAWGDVEAARARLLGLCGIAYATAERGSGRNFRWLVYDLITGECSERHHDSEIERLGYRRFPELSEAVRRELCETGREADYARAFFRRAPSGTWERYEPRFVRAEAGEGS